MGRRTSALTFPQGAPAPVDYDVMPMRVVAEQTRLAGAEMVRHWNSLAPIVRELTKRVHGFVEAPDTVWTPERAASLLHTAASVVEKLAKAGQAMFKVNEGQERLAVLLQGGVPRRPDAKAMSEKQLVGTVVATMRRVMDEDREHRCPVCGTARALDVTPAADA